MDDPMDIDVESVGELQEVAMPSLDDERKNEYWCLECACDASQPGQRHEKCPLEEGSAGRFTSALEDDKRRACRRMHALKEQMNHFIQQNARLYPELIKFIKYQQQGLQIKLFATLLYTNQVGQEHDDGDRQLDVRRYTGADGKPAVSIGIKDLGLWHKVDTELDGKPEHLKMVSFTKPPWANTSVSAKARGKMPRK